MTSFSLKEILDTVERIESKVDRMLVEPLNTAIDFCQARVQVGPGQVQVASRLGPGQLHLNSRSFNIKVYFKSLRDLDLELEAIIAMPPPPPPTIKLF